MDTHPTIITTQPLPDDIAGLTNGTTIWLNPNLTPAGRRCTLEHELVHCERGTPPPWQAAKEELTVERIAAHRLTPIEQLIEALIWNHGDANRAALAADLDIDITMLSTRLRTLTHDEVAQIQQALAGLPEGS